MVEKIRPIAEIAAHNQRNRNPYAHFAASIECPECGKTTHELYHVINEGEQPTLMCEHCYDNED